MKTISILAASVAAFLLAASPSFADAPQQPQTPAQTQAPAPTPPQAKRCYRSLHKVPFLVRARCKTPKMSAPSQPKG